MFFYGLCKSRWPPKMFLGLTLVLFCTSIRLTDALEHQLPLGAVNDNVYAKKVAIIGAGAGGSSTAYHLRKFAEEAFTKIDIDIYEKSDYIGGRSTTVNVYNDTTVQKAELGASIFVEVNTILVNAMKEFDLQPVSRGDHDDNEVMGVWNGEKFVLIVKDADSNWWSLTKLFWKYGLSPYRTDRLMKNTIGLFQKLYDAPFFPFRSLSTRVHDIGLVDFTTVTGKQLLAANGISDAFAQDVIQASTRVNYASNLNAIHGLETMVCMAINGQIQVEGGNWRIFSSMVNASRATQHLSTTISSVSKADNGKFVVTGDSTKANFEAGYDAVVLANPYQFSNIKIDESISAKVPDEIPYVTLHVTLFTTPLKLSAKYFNVAEGDPVPDTVLTTLPKAQEADDEQDIVGKAGFFSISTLRKMIHPTLNSPEYLYKIFSPKPMTSDFLSKIFDVELANTTHLIDLPTISNGVISWIYLKTWQSYPYELPRITFEDTNLAPKLYYTSGMESFISTMETMALMGKNVAQLIVDDFQRR